MDVITLNQTDSTNLHALTLWQQRPRPLVVLATTQSAGVGRSGRAWYSPPGGVWMTLAWPITGDLTRYGPLPLVTGMVVRDLIAEHAGVSPLIKWPNDLLIHERKVAGILCRAELNPLHSPVMLIGIGVNASFHTHELGDQLRQPATTLLDETGIAFDPLALGRSIADRLAPAIIRLETDGFHPHLTSIRPLLAWINQPVTCTDSTGETMAAGLFRGIDETGAALIEAGGELRAIAMGELHFSRAA